MVTAAIHFEWHGTFFAHETERDGMLALAGLLFSFLFIRTSARLMRSPRVPWWPGSVTSGDLHLHHLVWGIVLILLSGFLGFILPDAGPGREIAAAFFGIGAGLTLDEFALWIHLQDVYWTEEGRSSLDAVIVAMVIAVMIVAGVLPWHGDASTDPSVIIAVALAFAIAILCIIRGKVILGVVGFFFWPAGVVGAIRLAKPGSPWARRRYAAGSHKLARAEARWGRIEARRRRFGDLVAGAPSEEAAGG
jgi:hypothetical protein